MTGIYPADQGDLFGREQLAQGRLLTMPASAPESAVVARCPACSGVRCSCASEGHTAPVLEVLCAVCGEPLGLDDPHFPGTVGLVHPECCVECCGICHQPIDDSERLVRGDVAYHAICRGDLDADIAAGVS